MDDQTHAPIFIDFSKPLMDLPVNRLVHLCNVALNRMSLGELAETAFHAGLEIDLNLSGKKP